MRRFTGFMITVLALAAGIAIGYALARWGKPSRGGANDGGQKHSSAVARVQTVPIRLGRITRSVGVYGKVAANRGLERSVSVAFGSRVLKVFVIKNQRVEAGQPLLQIQASPAERLKLAEAANEVRITQAQLRLTQTKIKLQLATRADLVAARHALIAASLKLAQLRRLGVGTLLTLRAAEAATVVQVAAIPGALEPRGAALLNLLPHSAILVRLRVLPPDVRRLRVGQKIPLSITTQGAAIREHGTIFMIAGRVDPISGFVNVYVTPHHRANLLIGDYASGRVAVASSRGLIVPHAAVLPGNGGDYLFTVKGSHAVEHRVRKGVFNDQEVEVFAPNLHAGEPVVVVGTGVLTNGMTVEQRNQ